MSPELFDPEKFDLEDGRQTKHSDCYALGMVVYEVLSGRAPFSRRHDLVIIGAIIKGERPRRPRGEEGTWFSDCIWSVLERCWEPSPGDRPSIKVVLECLEGISRSWTPPSPTINSPPTTGSPAWNSGPSTEESTDESEVPSPSRTVSSQPLQGLSLGDPNENSVCPSAHEFSALPRGTLDQDLEASVINTCGSDLQEPAVIQDRVSRPRVLCGLWH